MNLPQFQIILQKINALDKNIMMDGKISKIEKDLMKAYVSQLYEACVNDSTTNPTMEHKIETVVPTPPTPKVSAPTTNVPVQNTQPPAVEYVSSQPLAPAPTQPVANTTVTPPIVPVQQTVQQPVEMVQPMDSSPNVSTETNTQNEFIDLNDRIADNLTNTKGKSLHERLADKNTGKTFNDRFTKEENTSSSTHISTPRMVRIPDSLKHLDNSGLNVPVTRPVATVTPPPTPVVPTPVTKIPPTPTSQPVHAGSVNINEVYAWFDDEQASEAAGKWGSTQIQDLSKSIGLNDKISMIKELFNDDHQAFNNALVQLNSLGNFAEAKDYMMRNLVSVFKWNEGDKIERAKQLINLVRRRYK